ncbi:MAG: hypothetical protein RIS70_1665, partial [Planctomycetota bacterium]
MSSTTASFLDAYRIHRVKRGETLWSIAARELNDPYRWPEIAKDNNIHEESKRAGVYRIYPNEPLLLRKASTSNDLSTRALNSRAFRLDLDSSNQCRIDDAGMGISSIGPSLRSQSIRIPGPVGSGVSPQAEASRSRKLQEPEGGMAPAVVKIKFPAGLKTKVFESVVARGTGIGYKYELAVSGEIKVQQHGDIQWWSDPAHGVVEYEKQVRLWGSETVVSLLNGYEIEGISSDPTKAPSIKVMVFGYEMSQPGQGASKSEKIFVKAPNVWVYEFETKTEFNKEGVDYVLELSNELTVTLLPKEQL